MFEAEKLNIYNIQGMEIALIPNLENSTYTWDVSGLVMGVYVLLVIDGQGVKQAIKFSIY